MNRTKIKNYAPQARRDFIQAVTDRAAFYGLTAERIEPVTVQGDVALISGRAFPREVAEKRKALQERVKRDGFGATMEALAYTWFNRLVAIRYMELHEYLDHGYRVLSNPDPAKMMPEILEHAEHVEMPGLNRDRVVELKLDGTKEAELYRLLLVAQCNALHSAMPFLFEQIGDETELVLPESLLHTDSIVRKLVSGIEEEDWQEVEIVGWLYEAYISERYEQVIGKVVAGADIPAATQRFTPKWIVRYLVQNTLGRLWLATYPNSLPEEHRKYYIEPAEQTPEVQEQLKAITPTGLNPEAITFLDPACGSAHILVEAYDLFKAIYQERGYRARDIPRLILTKNLFGLEIDDRAAQLAAFALMMKARADDRRIFDQGVQPQVRALVQTDGMDAADIAAALNVSGTKEALPPGQLFETEDNLFTRAASTAVRLQCTSLTDVAALVDLFQHAKTFGSLIQMPPALAARLPQIEQRCREVAGQTSEITSRTAAHFLPVIEQARMLDGRYDCVVANPPYMGTKYYNARIKLFINKNYKDSKADLYACFIERNSRFSKPAGFVGMITIPNWMFLTDFNGTRRSVLDLLTIDSLIHNGRGVFGSDFGSCSFVIRGVRLPDYSGTYRRLFDRQGSVSSNEELEQRFFEAKSFNSTTREFSQIPGCPIAYWASKNARAAFVNGTALGSLASPKIGMRTGDNQRFLRYWHEVAFDSIGFGCESATNARKSGAKWFPYNKGGAYRKWYGNNEYVVNWENDGQEIKQATREAYPELGENLGWKISNETYYFQPCITWTATSSSFFGVRHSDKGFLFDVKGSCCFGPEKLRPIALALLTTKQVSHFLGFLNPSIEFQTVDLARIPVHATLLEEGAMADAIFDIATQCVDLARKDWDSNETSWDFAVLPSLRNKTTTVEHSQEKADGEYCSRFSQMESLEEQNNRLFIEAYGLQDELSPEVPDDQITLYRPNREEDIKRLISYAVGCSMGRYSLDKPGLVYAQGGNVGFDPDQYQTLPADPDGIVPVMEADWFADDSIHRFVEFLGVAWPREHLEENLKFVADALGPSKGEQPRDTIRRYLAAGFYKHHLQTYKRRPIYWLFSSGRQRAFQCLLYLHRYHEGTLSRMRTEYVIPLQGKLASRIDQLAGEIPKATSTSHRNKLTKERDALLKQQAELQAYDEKLRHYADMQITLDLDDGVKVNYGKFGDLLAEAKAVTGGRDEE